ncbi:AraC family transcriptional regulator [Verrucomicrobiaceae bacterium 227]
MLHEKDLIKKAHQLGQPEDYFHGLDWGSEILPREIVSFCRVAQDHRTSGWDGISAKAGRYDQHARYVLLIALEGAGRMGVETDVREIHEGEALLLFPHQIHYYVELPEEFSWLYITFELEGEPKQALESWREGGRIMNPRAEELLNDFLEIYNNGDGLGASIKLGNALTELGQGQTAGGQVTSDGDLVARIKKHVVGNLEGDLAMPALSKAMGVSESYLRAVFREEAGVSLGNFVRSVRLVQSTYLLEQGQDDLGVIAEKTGFGSLTSFTRAFRRMYEMTPSSYRKRRRAEAEAKTY